MNMLRIAMPALAILWAIQPGARAADPPNDAHFHHVHLNVTDPAATLSFYKKYLGAVQVKYRGKVDALFSERSFILLNKVDEAPPWEPKTSIMHIGWAGKDGQSEYDWLLKQGVEFETPVSPFAGNFYMYFFGEDKELIEIYTGSQNNRFEHLHVWAKDPNVTANWFLEHLGIGGSARDTSMPASGLWMRALNADNVNLIIFALPDEGDLRPAEMGDDFEPTKGSTIDHLAYSYRDIEPVYERMKAAGADIVEGIAMKEEGHKSFFVLAPGKLLIEIVEDRPIPEGIWE